MNIYNMDLELECATSKFIGVSFYYEYVCQWKRLRLQLQLILLIGQLEN